MIQIRKVGTPQDIQTYLFRYKGECFIMQCIMCFEYVSWSLHVSYSAGGKAFGLCHTSS